MGLRAKAMHFHNAFETLKLQSLFIGRILSATPLDLQCVPEDHQESYEQKAATSRLQVRPLLSIV